MLSPKRPSTGAPGAILALSLVCVAATMLSSRPPLARASASSKLQQQISVGQNHISSLAGAVGAASSRLSTLRSSDASLERQIARAQAGLTAKRSELLTLRGQLTAAQTRLGQLEAVAAQAENVLSRQLIGAYEGDRSDIVSVVLEATGFDDLLERLLFAQRIRNQDVRIVGQASAARRAVAAQATRLGELGARQQTLTTQVLSVRNGLYRTRAALLQRQIAVSQAQAATAGQLATAHGQLAALEHQLSSVDAARAATPATAPNNQNSRSPAPSSGGFTFPMPKADASPPSTWTTDEGVDIAAPGGTPLLAVGSGTIVLHGIGGFGPSAPVLHLDSGQYVYYGHAGPGMSVPIGTHVKAGQVISQVGYGIVGISSGLHLEIGFADPSGSPIGSPSAPRMMSLLAASYAS
jgi:murein DD-endopeptidase MepM/ murein hydrolase activator NlpD